MSAFTRNISSVASLRMRATKNSLSTFTPLSKVERQISPNSLLARSHSSVSQVAATEPTTRTPEAPVKWHSTSFADLANSMSPAVADDISFGVGLGGLAEFNKKPTTAAPRACSVHSRAFSAIAASNRIPAGVDSEIPRDLLKHLKSMYPPTPVLPSQAESQSPSLFPITIGFRFIGTPTVPVSLVSVGDMSLFHSKSAEYGAISTVRHHPVLTLPLTERQRRRNILIGSTMISVESSPVTSPSTNSKSVLVRTWITSTPVAGSPVVRSAFILTERDHSPPVVSSTHPLV